MQLLAQSIARSSRDHADKEALLLRAVITHSITPFMHS